MARALKSLGKDAAARVQQNVATELLRLQKEPGVHPILLSLRPPVYDCRIEGKGADVSIHWAVFADGFDRSVIHRAQKDKILCEEYDEERFNKD